MNVLRISLFGYVQMECDSWTSEVKAPPVIQALLAYLLLKRDHYHRREILADLFWSDYDKNRARSCLSTALWRLRRVLEPEGVPKGTYLLTTPTGEVGFNWESAHWVDVVVFEEGVTETLEKPIQMMVTADIQNLEKALNLCTSDLLEGFYDDWAINERERLRQLYSNGLEHLMRYYKHQGAYIQSLVCGQQILDYDPLRESIHREMMRLYWKNGQSARAVRQFQTCRDILAKELNIAPMEETQLLFANIMSSTNQYDACPTIGENTINLQQALHQLHLAKQEFKEGQKKLEQAIRLVEQFSDH